MQLTTRPAVPSDFAALESLVIDSFEPITWQKKLDEKIIKNPAENNTIIYSFVPEQTDLYLIILSQKWKTKSMCGSFTIMQKADKSVPAKK